jgi:hypothetical protein
MWTVVSEETATAPNYGLGIWFSDGLKIIAFWNVTSCSLIYLCLPEYSSVHTYRRGNFQMSQTDGFVGHDKEYQESVKGEPYCPVEWRSAFKDDGAERGWLRIIKNSVTFRARSVDNILLL